MAAIGLAASIASLIDYLGPSPTFCAASGCAAVRESAWSHPLGIPMPVLGIAFFAAAIALGFVDAPRLRRALAIAGGAWALVLIGVQALAIGAWCKLCLVADPAAIGYALAVLAGASVVRFSLARGLAMVPALAAAIAGLALWTRAPGPGPDGADGAPAPAAAPIAEAPARPSDGLPEFVRAAQTPGAATVVEIVDFECPFCRRMQDLLSAAIAQIRTPVHVVRKMLPLSIHPHAQAAALAYCCADAQGKGDDMAAALFAAPPGDLTPEGCERLAAGIGCDLERYRRDLPAAEARVAADTTEVRAVGVHLLPTLYIGSEQIVGAGKSTDELVALLENARR
ncbi:MAG TPA: vitamin K epoxide reductase family protein [Kofleriaceae bacterium]|nr:vitamin K epoxide reductase family protein [Kofleriaceae bacterium]